MDSKSKLAGESLFGFTSLNGNRKCRPKCGRLATGKKCRYHGACTGYHAHCKWYIYPKKGVTYA